MGRTHPVPGETRFIQNRGWAISILADGRYSVGGRCDNTFILGPTSTATAPTNEWHHITATFDWANDEVSLYVDATPDGVASLVGCDGLTLTDKFHIGAISSLDTNHHFPGAIDDVVIYDRVLSASEVQSLFEAELSPDAVPTLSEWGLVAFVLLLLGAMYVATSRWGRIIQG